MDTPRFWIAPKLLGTSCCLFGMLELGCFFFYFLLSQVQSFGLDSAQLPLSRQLFSSSSVRQMFWWGTPCRFQAFYHCHFSWQPHRRCKNHKPQCLCSCPGTEYHSTLAALRYGVYGENAVLNFKPTGFRVLVFAFQAFPSCKSVWCYFRQTICCLRARRKTTWPSAFLPHFSHKKDDDKVSVVSHKKNLS